MLSYQHIYHAGNLADVQKHMLLTYMLDYLTQKDKPVSYIETHSGRGIYDLGADEAVKTGEAASGIALLEGHIRPDHPYLDRLADARAGHGPMAYPGSPMLAALSLRETDTVHLAELHPQEFAALQATLTPWGAHVYQQDGLKLAQAICPPTPRRGLLLIDPSYEVKSDYTEIPKVMGQLARKWNVGILALWYPILTHGAQHDMLDDLAARFPDGLRHEVHFPPVRDGHRMIGSGMFIVNAPYGTEAECAEISRIFAKLE